MQRQKCSTGPFRTLETDIQNYIDQCNNATYSEIKEANLILQKDITKLKETFQKGELKINQRNESFFINIFNLFISPFVTMPQNTIKAEMIALVLLELANDFGDPQLNALIFKNRILSAIIHKTKSLKLFEEVCNLIFKFEDKWGLKTFSHLLSDIYITISFTNLNDPLRAEFIDLYVKNSIKALHKDLIDIVTFFRIISNLINNHKLISQTQAIASLGIAFNHKISTSADLKIAVNKFFEDMITNNPKNADILKQEKIRFFHSFPKLCKILFTEQNHSENKNYQPRTFKQNSSQGNSSQPTGHNKKYFKAK